MDKKWNILYKAITVNERHTEIELKRQATIQFAFFLLKIWIMCICRRRELWKSVLCCATPIGVIQNNGNRLTKKNFYFTHKRHKNEKNVWKSKIGTELCNNMPNTYVNWKYSLAVVSFLFFLYITEIIVAWRCIQIFFLFS